MISFRFHVVSITAVFLAIAIGVVVGTTYVDGAIVDGLRNRIDSVEENLDERRAENDQLEGELERAGAYTDASDDYAVTDRLTGVPVLLVATRGIDEGVVEQTALLAQQAGAITPGIVWLEGAWSLEGEDERSALADLVGGSADDPVEDLWAATWDAIVVELTEGDSTEVGPTTTTLDDEAATPLLLALEAGGFISIDAIDDESPSLDDLVGTTPRVLAVTGQRAQEAVSTMVPAVVNAAVDGGLSVVVADVYVEAPEAPGRGDLLQEALPEALRDVIVFVDNADRADGRVAAVLGLDWVADGTGNAGHFGYGAGADGVLPPWTAP
jgi:hypothetical protein